MNLVAGRDLEVIVVVVVVAVVAVVALMLGQSAKGLNAPG